MSNAKQLAHRVYDLSQNLYLLMIMFWSRPENLKTAKMDFTIVKALFSFKRVLRYSMVQGNPHVTSYIVTVIPKSQTYTILAECLNIYIALLTAYSFSLLAVFAGESLSDLPLFDECVYWPGHQPLYVCVPVCSMNVCLPFFGFWFCHRCFWEVLLTELLPGTLILILTLAIKGLFSRVISICPSAGETASSQHAGLIPPISLLSPACSGDGII